MEAAKPTLTIDDIGVADALSRWQLKVPVNQRRYAWDEEYVEQLFFDFTKAFDDHKPIYFLGTVVLTEGAKAIREVADGQQRLATVSILLAAIRDYLIELEDQAGAEQYQSEFLIKYDPPSGQYRPRLTLNVEDDSFFYNRVILPPKKRPQELAGKFSSNERIELAAKKAHDHVRNITAALPPADKPKRLYDWIEFLQDKALVVAITVPSHISDAFRMFETLNARGLRASQVDVLKNFLLGRAPDHIDQMHPKWVSMLGTIEALGGDELMLAFIRHLWISQHGPTTQNELGEAIEKTIKKEQQAIDFVSLLDSASTDYVALLTPLQHPRWIGFSPEARKALDILSNHLEAVQIRPLMMAVARCFKVAEAEKAFRMFVSWSVRFLIVGGGGGGKLDRYYGLRAHEVTQGKIKTSKELAKSMGNVVPGNTQFEEEFAKANVRKSALARYYLRAIEVHGEEKFPQLLINEDANAVNLEHVMPVNPSKAWAIDRETAETWHKRLGNMVLLGTKDNVTLGNGTFETKRPILKASPFKLTREVAVSKQWGPDQIKERQTDLAKLASKVWPL
jgi:hypothetical protein